MGVKEGMQQTPAGLDDPVLELYIFRLSLWDLPASYQGFLLHISGHSVSRAQAPHLQSALALRHCLKVGCLSLAAICSLMQVPACI